MNPYETLNVNTDATTDEIKQAYRKAANKSHPDKEGGDAEEFKIVSVAYQILKDPDRRAQYDETGDMGGGPQSDPVLDRAAQLFNNIIEREQFGGDIITKCEVMVDNAKIGCESEIEKAGDMIGKLTKQLNRVTATGDINLFENLIRNKIDALQKQLDHFISEKALLTSVGELLEGYSDAMPQPHETQWGSHIDVRV